MKVSPVTGANTILQGNGILSPEALRVQKALDEFGLPLVVLELPDSTRTSQEAAAAIGCELGQIAKSMVFENRDSGEVILVIASGGNRVEVEQLQEIAVAPGQESCAQPPHTHDVSSRKKNIQPASQTQRSPVQNSHVGNSPFRLASPELVHEKTGFVVGGVPPVGHRNPLPTYIDADLEQYDEIWAAAGTAHAVFRLTPDELLMITRGVVVTIH